MKEPVHVRPVVSSCEHHNHLQVGDHSQELATISPVEESANKTIPLGDSGLNPKVPILQGCTAYRTESEPPPGGLVNPILRDQLGVTPFTPVQKQLTDLCQVHGIENVQTASNMIVTVKRRFRAALEQNVRRTLLNGDQTPDEIEELLHFFRKSAQDFE